jgi:predicted acylesterase/phospholipase RssA
MTETNNEGPSVASAEGYEYHNLPDWDNDFYNEDDILAFASALSAPEVSPSEEDLLNPKRPVEFITALNDWKPVHRSVKESQEYGYGKKKSKRRKKTQRGKDETREGWTYSIVKWPLLILAMGWLLFLTVLYLITRFYIFAYERFVTWRGKRDRLRKSLRKQTSHEGWKEAAQELDHYLGSDKWKVDDEYAYYDDRTIRRVFEQMRRARRHAQQAEEGTNTGLGGQRPVERLVELTRSSVKNNFAGFENSRLYSQTYYGTKDLVQDFVNEVSTSLQFLFSSRQLTTEEKRDLAKHLSTNFGRTALCLSGGAGFAWYHFGLAKALLEADLLPNIITGTSGGALVAALLATRTDEELKKLLVPALAHRITACHDPVSTWLYRWWRTGARFDAVDWAKRCSWFTRGNLTFLEAYQRTGRILNVTCVPSDPHTPNILANYLTAPDCVIWSAVLASAAVPGILNPVVLMRKTRQGKLESYSFGHKWKDGSLKTDIPLKSLNLHFNVNFSIVSQVNPHINLFFFSSRGTVGRPVTHRRGRGWRGGFLGSALEQYLKLDLNKWLKVLRHLELLPRPLGQDWSEIWLQKFSGTITIWPKSVLGDFYYILSDPSMQRLARMLQAGQLAAWPKLKFISNRMAIEKVIEEARESTRPDTRPPSIRGSERRLRNVLSEDDLQDLLEQARNNNGVVEVPVQIDTAVAQQLEVSQQQAQEKSQDSPSVTKRWSDWFGSISGASSPRLPRGGPSMSDLRPGSRQHTRRGSMLQEWKRQSQVFWDDNEPETAEEDIDYETASEVGSDEDEPLMQEHYEGNGGGTM